ncbi:MAG TPA: hypothetical protein PLF13_02380 [candidate division Zixibacteria bacterium]|nr:hypothetical protein [candidate division Zixibacteria bacterium]
MRTSAAHKINPISLVDLPLALVYIVTREEDHRQEGGSLRMAKGYMFAKTFAIIVATLVLVGAAYAQDTPPPQITAEKAVELAREYVIGADTVAEKALKMGEPKLAPLPRDTNVPLDSLLFPDLLLDRPAWAIDLEGFRPIFWKDLNPRMPLPPDKGTVYIDAETGRLLKVMLVDAERFVPTTDTVRTSLNTLFGAYKRINWSLSKPTPLTLATVLSRGDVWPPYGALALSAYFVETEFPEGYPPSTAMPRPGEPCWMIGIKWRLDVPVPAPGAQRRGLKPGWTVFFLKEQKAQGGQPGMSQLDVPEDWW